jgi:hypothetical protein
MSTDDFAIAIHPQDGKGVMVSIDDFRNAFLGSLTAYNVRTGGDPANLQVPADPKKVDGILYHTFGALVANPVQDDDSADAQPIATGDADEVDPVG